MLHNIYKVPFIIKVILCYIILKETNFLKAMKLKTVNSWLDSIAVPLFRNSETNAATFLREPVRKKYGIFLEFFPYGGGEGLPKSQNFCDLTKSFLACQNHSEVLKHVLQ